MLTWSGPDVFTLGATSFRATFAPFRSQPASFVLRKRRWMVEQYEALRAELEGARVVELGIDEGGSTAFLAELLRPSAMLALEISAEPSDALAGFLAVRELTSRVHPVYGVDQGDRPAVEEALRRHLGDEPLDLVVDDASHVLEPTRVSFEALFPRLRPGGVFVLEDWSWDLGFERALRADPERFEAALAARPVDAPPGPAGLGRLVAEIVLASGYAPQAVDSVAVRENFAIVRRGSAPLDPETFELAACYGSSGRRVFEPEGAD